MSQAKETFMSDRERELNDLPIIYAGMTKTDIAIAAKSAVDNLLESGNPLKIAEQVAAMEAFLKEIKGDDRYTKAVRDEVEKYGKTYTAASGAKIEVAEVGTKYDFSKCEDIHYTGLLEQRDLLDQKIKDREAFLKTLPTTGFDVVDVETGDYHKIYPPSKSSTSSFKVTISK